VVVDPPSKAIFNRDYKEQFSKYEQKGTLFVFLPAACRLSAEVYRGYQQLNDTIIRASSKHLRKAYVALL
jgi:hypothetical protein